MTVVDVGKTPCVPCMHIQSQSKACNHCNTGYSMVSSEHVKLAVTDLLCQLRTVQQLTKKTSLQKVVHVYLQLLLA